MKTPKILFTIYYHVVHYLRDAAEALINAGGEVIPYPLFQYTTDAHDRLDQYPEHFRKTVKRVSPEAILFWCVAIDPITLAYVKQAFPEVLLIHTGPEQALELTHLWDVVLPVGQPSWAQSVMDAIAHHQGSRRAQLPMAMYPDDHYQLMLAISRHDVPTVLQLVRRYPQLNVSEFLDRYYQKTSTGE